VFGDFFFRFFFVVEGNGSEREEVFLFFGGLFNFRCIFNYTNAAISVVNFSEISWSVGIASSIACPVK
jgi:hypothetical protein